MNIDVVTEYINEIRDKNRLLIRVEFPIGKPRSWNLVYRPWPFEDSSLGARDVFLLADVCGRIQNAKTYYDEKSLRDLRTHLALCSVFAKENVEELDQMILESEDPEAIAVLLRVQHEEGTAAGPLGRMML